MEQYTLQLFQTKYIFSLQVVVLEDSFLGYVISLLWLVVLLVVPIRYFVHMIIVQLMVSRENLYASVYLLVILLNEL